MRFLVRVAADSLAELRDSAAATAAAGLDGVLVTATEALPAPLVCAAALAAIDDVLIAVEVAVGDRHPLEVAEEAAVADQLARGRLIVVAMPAPGCAGTFGEALDVVRAARAMPPPFGPRVEVWVRGVEVDVAVRRGLGHVAEPGQDDRSLARAWDASVGPAPACARARHEAVADEPALVRRLRAGRAAWAQDWAIVTEEGRPAAARARPRVQLDTLPAGLVRHWDSLERTVG